MKIAEEHDSSAETGTGERSVYAAFPLYSKFTTTWRVNMSERTVIAYFEVAEDRAFDGFGDGPVPYLEHEAVCLEKSSIFLTGAAIADEDADDRRKHIWCTLQDSASSTLVTAMLARCPIRNGETAEYDFQLRKQSAYPPN